MYSDLTEKQKRFVDEYMIDLNATQAYMRAGYTAKSERVANASASKLLANSKVQAAINERRQDQTKRTEVTADRIIKELATIAFSDVTEFVTVDEDSEGKLADVKLTELLNSEQRRVISSIKQGANGVELKLYDKMKALELLGKTMKLFTDRVEAEHSGEVNVKFAIPRPSYKKPEITNDSEDGDE